MSSIPQEEIREKFHDIGNCLNAITGNAQILAIQYPKEKEATDTILLHSQNILTIIKDIYRLLDLKKK